jgi:CRISPR-associated endoribonuclease Cas6
LVELRANTAIAHNPRYHHKLRGAWWGLIGDVYDLLHDAPDEVRFSFSNPFPPKDLEAGDTQHVIFASPHDRVVELVARKLDEGDTFTIGEASYTVESVVKMGLDVGEPGTRGTLRTASGVYVPLRRDRWDEFGIDPDIDTDIIGWTNDYSIGLFLQRLRENLTHKHEQVFADYLNSPADDGTALFEDTRLKRIYGVPAIVSTKTNYEFTFVVSKWEFDYHVKNDDHRRWLNLALDAGLGARNPLGFGFVNPVEESWNEQEAVREEASTYG